jgi:hypothetical protein
MHKKEIDVLVSELEQANTKGKLNEALQRNPQIVLPLRLSLGLSQVQFIDELKHPISQPTLIRYERGDRKKMSEEKARLISDSVPLTRIAFNRVWNEYKKFDGMMRGKHMTRDRGKELQKLWLKKTTKTQRQRWGRKGAVISNVKPRLTNQERAIKKVLDKKVGGDLTYRMHQQISTSILSINVDFVVYEKNTPTCFIEATTRKRDLVILSQAYSYRKRLLAEQYPDAKNIIIIDNPTYFAKRILDKEYDFVFNTTQFEGFDIKIMASRQHT